MDIAGIRAAMDARSIGVRELARLAHYDVGYVSRALQGRQPASRALLRALSEALDGRHEGDRIAYVLAHPTKLDAEAVRLLADALADQRRADDVMGPAPLVNAAERNRTALLRLMRNSRGPHVPALADVVAEHVQFTGWLLAELRHDARAVALLGEAVALADAVESGPLAAQATNFHGWLARQQGRPHASAKWFYAAYMTPGAHPAQRMGDAAQAAQQYALLGDRQTAERLLGEATDLSDAANRDAPPETAYWLTGNYQHLNLGLAHLGLGSPRRAADHLRHGLGSLPDDQKDALWAREYRTALRDAQLAA